MSTSTNDHTLVKAGDNRGRRLQSTAQFRLLPRSLTRPEVQTTDDTVHTIGMYLPGNELTPASSTHEAAVTSIQSPRLTIAGKHQLYVVGGQVKK